MNKIEKTAAAQIIVSIVHSVLFITLSRFHPVSKAFQMSCLMFLFYGIIPFLILKKDRKQNIIADERDVAINKKASIIGFGSFWVAFALLVTVILQKTGISGTIPAVTLLYILLGGMALIYTVRAASILLFYRVG